MLDSISTSEGKVKQSVADASSYLAGLIGNAVSNIGNKVDSVGGAIIAVVNSQAASIRSTISDVGDSIVTGIKEILKGFLPSLLETLTQNTQALSSFVATLLGQLASIDQYWQASSGEISKRWSSASDKLVDLQERLTHRAIPTMLLDLALDAFPDSRDALRRLADDQSTPEPFRAFLQNLIAEDRLLALVTTIGMAIGVSFGYPGAVAAGPLTRITQESLERTLPSLPSLPEIVAARQRGMTTEDFVKEVAGRQGYQDKWVAVFRLLLKVRLTELQLLDLWLRGEMEEPTLNAELNLLGHDATNQRWLKILAFRQPTQSDLVLFLVREVYSPEQRSVLDLDADYPPAATAQMRKIGVPEELAKNYWAAHWQLPSPTQGYEMLHRGLIDATVDRPGAPSLRSLLRAADFSPVWRPLLEQISFNPLTRIDIRRMHRLGVLSDTELTRAFLNIGYNPTNAEQLKEFTIRLNKSEAEAEIDHLTSSLRSSILSALRAGKLSPADATESLTTMGLSSEAIQFYTSETAFLRQLDLADDLRSAIERLYEQGFWSEDKAKIYLADQGFDNEELDRLFVIWRLRRQLRDLSESEKAQRDLTRSDVLSAYEDRIITSQLALTMLANLGYDANEAGLLIARTDLARQRADTTVIRESVHTLYLAGKIDRATATTRLDAAGIVPEQRNALLVRWDVEREMRAPELPLQMLEDMRRGKIIDDDVVRAELTQRGYSVGQISAILRLWGSQVEEARLRQIELEKERQRHLAEVIEARQVRDLATAARAREREEVQDIIRRRDQGRSTDEQAAAELRRLGYNRAVVVLLLTRLEATIHEPS